MKSQFLFLALYILCACPLFGEAIHLQLQQLEIGSRIVYELPQSIITISVTKKDAHELALEIGTATKDVLERENMSSWLAWCRAGMPSASFRDTLTLSLPEGRVKETSPLFHNTWLITLFSLDMKQVPLSLRKKAGPTPMAGEGDFRKPWQPRIVVHETRLDTTSTAYSVDWPQDDSCLSGRKIILYFPEATEAVKALPYWIESPSSQYKVFAIDSEKQN